MLWRPQYIRTNNTNDVTLGYTSSCHRLFSQTADLTTKRKKNKAVSLSITFCQSRLTNSLDLLGSIVSWEAGTKYMLCRFVPNVKDAASIETSFLYISVPFSFPSFEKSSVMQSWWTGKECSAFWCTLIKSSNSKLLDVSDFVRPPFFFRCLFLAKRTIHFAPKF